MKHVCLFLVLTVLSMGLAVGQATPPEVINYQGVLRDTSDGPLNGPHDMVFRFYATEAAGNLLLQDSHTAADPPPVEPVTVASGLFSAHLGGGTVTPGVYATLSEVFASASEVWLEIDVGGEILSPRVRVVSTGYALNSSYLAGRPASEFIDTSSTLQTKSGPLTVDASSTAATGLQSYGQSTGGYFSGDLASAYVASNGTGITASGFSYGAYFYDADNSGQARIGSNDSGIQASGNDRGGVFWSTAGSGSASVGYGDIGIEATGNQVGGYFNSVGIGTDSPTAALEVIGDMKASGVIESTAGFKLPDGTTLTAAGDGHSLDAVDGDPTDAVYVDEQGNVGIGTTNPGSRLHLISSTAAAHFEFTGTTGDTAVLAEAKADTGYGIGLTGISHSPSGNAVFGRNSASSGSTAAVLGWSMSSDGTGVRGRAELIGVAGETTGTSEFSAGVVGHSDVTTGSGKGVWGKSDSTSGTGVRGDAYASSGTTYGVWGKSTSAEGTGVRGEGGTYGVEGSSPGTEGIGVRGSGGTYGVEGLSVATGVRGSGAARGVSGLSFDGTGVYGLAQSSSGSNYGVHGRSDGDTGRGVLGHAAAPSGITYGLYGQSDSDAGRGVYGHVPAPSGVTYGVSGQSDSPSGRGVYGLASAISGLTNGVRGKSDSTTGSGVYGLASAGSGVTYGVRGEVASPDGTGVDGFAYSDSGGTGVHGRTDGSDGTGVYGYAASPVGGGEGVYARSDGYSGLGVYGYASSPVGYTKGVFGKSKSENGSGVSGWADASLGRTYGVFARSDSEEGRAVGAWASADSGSGTNYAILAQNTNASGYAGYFQGDVTVAGYLAKLGGGFRIDHPFDPANKYLNHSFVESPDMMNLYNGNTVTDELGHAEVSLPEWFETLNRDYRYQLTVIGEPAQAAVAEEIQDNRFTIRTDEPHVKVSWQVTGVRHDPWAEAHRLQVEEDKPQSERGKYINPELYDIPEELAIGRLVPPEFEHPRETPQVAGDSVAQDSRRKRPAADIAGSAQQTFGLGTATASLPVDEQGNVYAKAFHSASSELAALVPVSETVGLGDVLVADIEAPGRVRPSQIPADAAVVGIVAGEPGVVLGGGVERLEAARSAAGTEVVRDPEGIRGKTPPQARAAVAFSGIVLCKVDAGYGSVRLGDLLTTSATPGHAMRADDPQPGTILGKALEPLDTGTGLVKVLVMLR